uniref:Uncharacterized protein n=1 Tax=Chenopodium quinoa TaxID=63459 RepID=A0A803LH58_CHEQI
MPLEVLIQPIAEVVKGSLEDYDDSLKACVEASKMWMQAERRCKLGLPPEDPAAANLLNPLLRRKSLLTVLRQNASRLLMEDIYRNPSPLQFDGPCVDAKVVSVCAEDQFYMGCIKHLQEFLDKVYDPFTPLSTLIVSCLCGHGSTSLVGDFGV